MQLASVDERGTLEQISFALLLIRALDRRWTGTLLLGAQGEDQHVIEVDRGLVCRVTVPDDHARLGAIMVEAGVIKEPELEAALARDDVLIGQAILEAGHIDDKTLERALVLQVLKRLERLFGLPTSTPWAFGSDRSAFEGMPSSVRVDTLRALWAGVSQHGETGRWLDASLERIGKSPFRMRRDVNLRRFGFTGDARNLVRVIRDERLDLDQLVARGIAPEEICRQIVYLLAITRYLDFSAAAAASESKPPVEASDSVDDLPSIGDEPSADDSQAGLADGGEPKSGGGRLARSPRRVAKIALRRVTVSRQPAAAPDPPGSGEPSSKGGKRSRAATESGAGLPERVESRLAQIADETPFQNIGLDPSKLVGKDEDTVAGLLWHAYTKTSKRWHPDKCPEDQPDLREAMAKIHEAASEAFALLSDPETRALFLADVEPSGEDAEGPSAGEEQEPVSGERAVEAATLSGAEIHSRSLTALSEERLDEALRLAKAAIEAEPDNPDFLASAAWIRAAQDKPKLNVILMDLDDLLEAHPGHVSARYYRGVIRRRVGDAEGARGDLEVVVDAQPGHAGAQKALASLKKASRG